MLDTTDTTIFLSGAIDGNILISYWIGMLRFGISRKQHNDSY